MKKKTKIILVIITSILVLGATIGLILLGKISQWNNTIIKKYGNHLDEVSAYSAVSSEITKEDTNNVSNTSYIKTLSKTKTLESNNSNSLVKSASTDSSSYKDITDIKLYAYVAGAYGNGLFRDESYLNNAKLIRNRCYINCDTCNK